MNEDLAKQIADNNEHELQLAEQIAVNSGDIRDMMMRLIDEVRDTREQLREATEENKRLEALGTPVDSSYARLAMRTAADTWHQPTIDQEDGLVRLLFDFARQALVLDAYKAALFYGKPFEWPKLPQNHHALLINAYSTKRIHAILGIASEAGEMVERLLKEMRGFNGTGFWEETVANYTEEQGDLDWYQELLASTPGMDSVEDARRANIAKLAKRYPEKFTTEAAIARADKASVPREEPLRKS